MSRTSAAFRLALILAISSAAESAYAQDASAAFKTQVWINPGIYSFHFDRDKDLRNDNIGFGVEALFANDHGAMGGTFINSNRERSNYAVYLWRPLHWDVSGLKVSAGVLAGAFDGYPNYRNGGWFAAAMPLLSVEGDRFGANFTIVPTYANRLDGAFAVQLKFRVW